MGEFGSGQRRTVNVVLGPEQRIDRVSALRGMTTWAADFLLRGDRIGSLEPGKLADVVVIDKDYFTIPEPEIMNLKTLMTVWGGKGCVQSIRLLIFGVQV
ncbi:MAG: amidohydrolase family protein [Acidobacteria bacterium]|nr:amidohydrolase family protein [Acidobacteriota bacterium]